MIVVTGAAGFIGSNLVAGLNQMGERDILAVDDLTQGDKFVNLADLHIAEYLDKDVFRERVLANDLPPLRAVLHQGACSDTTERNGRYLMDNNYRVSLELLRFCQERRIPLLYASSAAVYGAGPKYIEQPEYERPLNTYGYSKLLFDQAVRRVLPEAKAPIVGLRYFNVYGPREQHKGRMASVAHHHQRQFSTDGVLRLFEGCDGYGNGEQRRDFIWVGDVVAVNLYFLRQASKSGIFNCGTGWAQSFNEVAQSVVNGLRARQQKSALSVSEMVEQGCLHYIPFPEDLRGRYQSFTQADDTALRAAGYDEKFLTVQQGIEAYLDAVVPATLSSGA